MTTELFDEIKENLEQMEDPGNGARCDALEALEKLKGKFAGKATECEMLRDAAREQKAYITALTTERDELRYRLQAWNDIHAESSALREDRATRLEAALRAVLVMWDRGAEPKKLDEALTWRENDEKARAMAAAALATDTPATELAEGGKR